jgi:hypothetical protein
MHILSDANGLPLLVGLSAGNTHDSEGLKPMVADGCDGSASASVSPAKASSPAND